jgi:hypothetical protein
MGDSRKPRFTAGDRNNGTRLRAGQQTMRGRSRCRDTQMGNCCPTEVTKMDNGGTLRRSSRMLIDKKQHGACRTVEMLLEQHPGLSRSAIRRRVTSPGLSTRRNSGYEPWSEEADRMLISCEGFEMERIERRMKRSMASIRSRLAALDRDAELFGVFRTKDLMDMLHVDELAIRRLERRRLLLRERGRITEDSLRSLCREHPEEIPFETLDEDTKRILVAYYDYPKPRRGRQGGRRRKQPNKSQQRM